VKQQSIQQIIKGGFRGRVVPVLLLTSLLVCFSLSASAFCVTCVAMVAATAQQTALVGALGDMEAEVIEAIEEAGAGDGSTPSGPTIALEDAAQNMAGQNTAVQELQTFHEVRATHSTSMQSVNCRLQTVNDTASMIQEKFQQTVALNLQDGVINLFFNKAFDPRRTRVATMQRNCKNGQFLKTDFGITWWNGLNAASPATGQCFEDLTDADADGAPDFSHGFMYSSTVLNHRVLVPPSSADMSILNNPDDPANAKTAQATWTGLNAKQKLYVSAVRFCENMALYALQPMGVRGDAAMSPDNQQVIMQNFSAIAKLDALVYACRSEVARRTAPDAAAMVTAGYADMAKVKDNAEKAAVMLIGSGAKPEEFQDLDAGGALVSYMSPAMLAYARSEAFCANHDAVKAFYADQGDDAAKTKIVLRCEALKMTNQETEHIYRSLFNTLAGGTQRIGSQFADKVVTPLRAEANSPLQKVSFSNHSQSIDKKLVDMLKRYPN
jgi:hypothetical protein